MKKLLLLICILVAPVLSHAQSCSPFGGVGNVQFLDNSGAVLTSGVLYSFQAATSTQQATFTDSTCTIQNVNPITFGTGARVAIWLTTANFYKFVLCSQNDGSSCSAGDVLFSVDNVPGGVTGGAGGGGSPFISGSANPATSGILRLASGDAICWRNTANSANLCFTKDTNDLLSWAGGSFKLPEIAAPTSVPGFDILEADSTAHRYKQCSNGAACAQIANAGVDISATDTVTQLHFGATATPLSGTAPTTNQFLRWDGTNIVGAPTDATLIAPLNNGSNTSCITNFTSLGCAVYILPGAHTLLRLVTQTSTAPSGCGVNAIYGVRDVTSSTTLATLTPTTSGILDSGALSVAMPAGHQMLIGLLTQATGCGTQGITGISATYQ